MNAFDPSPLRPDAPASPVNLHEIGSGSTIVPHSHGLTARQHAAIALRVPDSGTPWLDDMIRARMRDDFACVNMPRDCAWSDIEFHPKNGVSLMVNDALRAYEQADAMMEARDANR